MVSILFCLLLLSAPAFHPSVVWTSATAHHFGHIAGGQPVSHSFRFVNRSQAPLIIDNVRTTCGCTAPDWPRYPILPDSSGSVEVTYDAQKSGEFQKTIKVYFHGIRQAERLQISGTVTAH